MGVLQKMVHILQKIDPLNSYWQELQMEKALKETESVFQLADKETRKQKLIEINEAFDTQVNDPDYARKLFLIENCIYGVDIQPIAAQISKLRFFISLVVDQKVDKTKTNFGIRPLPNLETKFVAANTLICIEKPKGQLCLSRINEDVEKITKELKEVRHKIFSVKDPDTKRKYRNKDRDLRKIMGKQLLMDGWDDETSGLLAQWDPYDQNVSSAFFDPEWMFGVRVGFDIVIGNPPYVQIQKFPKSQKDQWISQGYQTYAATTDIYCLFYERGSGLLKSGGHLCFITSNNWMRANYGVKLRKFFSTKVNPLKLLDFGMGLNFSAAAALTNILLFAKQDNAHQTKCCYAADSQTAMADPDGYFQKNAVEMVGLDENSWVVIEAERYKIKKLVEIQGVPLQKWDLNIYRGILTGFNEAFYLTQEQRDELIVKEPKAEKIIVPLLRGRYVERYGTNWDKTWMINSHNGVKEWGIPPVNIQQDYPILFNHLQQWENKLIKRQDKGNRWSNLRNCVYVGEFLKPKIIYHEMSKNMTFYYDRNDHYYTNDTCYIATSNSESLTTLTAIFNSPLFRFCFKDNFPEIPGNTRRVKKVFFEKIPIKKPTTSQSSLFSKLVAAVQFAKKEKQVIPASNMEGVINGLVCQLYFNEHMQEKQIDILQFVKKDLAGVMQDRDFEQLPDSEKENIINQLHARWTHPDSEVRNRIKLFAVRSPEILKPILESR